MSGQEPRRSAGLRAFLRLARPGGNGEITILSETGERDWDLLAGLWRGKLRDRQPDGVARGSRRSGVRVAGGYSAETSGERWMLDVRAREPRGRGIVGATAEFAWCRAGGSVGAAA